MRNFSSIAVAALSFIGLASMSSEALAGRCEVRTYSSLKNFDNTREECQKECDRFKNDEERTCTWKNIVLRAIPIGECIIKSSLGKSLYIGRGLRKSECVSECGKLNGSNPDRSCVWEPGSDAKKDGMQRVVIKEAAPAAPEKPAVTAEVGKCSVTGGAGKEIAREGTSRADCQKSCDDAKEFPNRSCVWKNVTLRETPKGNCEVKTGAGKELYKGSDVSRLQCVTQCDKFNSSDANRSCVWEPNSAALKLGLTKSVIKEATPEKPAVTAEVGKCNITGGAGKEVNRDNSSRADCQKSCDDEKNYPNRSCTWKNITLRETPKGNCEVKAGAGKELYKGSDVSRLQCVTQCDKFNSSDANRSCVWEPNSEAQKLGLKKDVLKAASPTIAVAVEVGKCNITGGAGKEVNRDNSSRADCQKSCDDEKSYPNRSCTWKNVTLRETPKGNCEVKGNAGKQLYRGSDVSRLQCVTQCDKFNSSDANRSCVWEPNSAAQREGLQKSTIK